VEKFIMKAICMHKKSGVIFAIETDDAGEVVSTCGPLLFQSLDPKLLDYDDYPLGTGWNGEIVVKMGEFEKISVGAAGDRVCSRAAHPTEITEFERLGRDEYRELLIKNGFVIQSQQRYFFKRLRTQEPTIPRT
jgi:hypothetical protein